MARKNKKNKKKAPARRPQPKAKGKAKAKAKRGTKPRPKAARRPAAKPARTPGVPAGYHTVQISLSIAGARRALDFFVAAFGAVPREIMSGPGGSIMHGEVLIGDSVIMFGDAQPEQGFPPTKTKLYLYVPDCDALFARAVAAGATPAMPPMDMFWGDRYGNVEDPFGNTWGIATRKEVVSGPELERRAAEFMAKMAAGGGGGGAGGGEPAGEGPPTATP